MFLYVFVSFCMFLYVYVCLCMFMHVYVCMYVCTHACMCVYMCVCMYVRMYVCMHVCMYACMYVCMHVCMHACMYVCMYVIVDENATYNWGAPPTSQTFTQDLRRSLLACARLSIFLTEISGYLGVQLMVLTCLNTSKMVILWD